MGSVVSKMRQAIILDYPWQGDFILVSCHNLDCKAGEFSNFYSIRHAVDSGWYFKLGRVDCCVICPGCYQKFLKMPLVAKQMKQLEPISNLDIEKYINELRSVTSGL